jgi:hypothetical protein
MNSLYPVDPATNPPAEDAMDTGNAMDPAPNTTLAAPHIFRAAVQSLADTRIRPEVRVEPLRAPQRLAPYSYAVGADVLDAEGGELATGRLVLLHDPDGQEAWDGVLRLVAYASAELDEDMLVDPLLPTVGWSWLTGALDDRGARYQAAGGTVTQTTSTRFGDIVGPRTSVALELRASWTPTTPTTPTNLTTADGIDLGPHLSAFIDLLCTAAGLPPEGVSILTPG